jgi:hypothetical protein
MSIVGHPGTDERCASWRRLLILLAVLSLTLTLATRYTQTASAVISLDSSISSVSSGAKTQHLLADGLQWTAPVTTFIVLVVPHYPRQVIPPVLPVTALYSENWLYNRPPPSC